jgi:hypothetical protein
MALPTFGRRRGERQRINANDLTAAIQTVLVILGLRSITVTRFGSERPPIIPSSCPWLRAQQSSDSRHISSSLRYCATKSSGHSVMNMARDAEFSITQCKCIQTV